MPPALHPHARGGGPPTFAVVSCIRSIATSGIAQNALATTSLYRTLLPSIAATVTESERQLWSVKLYLCADDDDDLYKKHADAVISAGPSWLTIRLLFYPRVPNRVPNREAAQQALLEGAEFIHRTNDDILYMTPGWITSSTQALARFHPPNVGIAGPKVYGDGSTNKMHGGVTIDVVHRTHLRIFREYYPPQLDNWFTDSWIVYVYVALPSVAAHQMKRVMKLTRRDNFSVLHSFEKRRYAPTTSQAKLLAALVECGRYAIWSYINHTLDGTKYGRPVSCRAYSKMPSEEEREKDSGSKIGVCKRRVGRVGGLEMNERDFIKSSNSVEGWCQLIRG